MPLRVGQSFGSYEVLGPLGAGGMGEVYRARDTRLQREVAIKVLPDELAHDVERRQRFEREARTLASLNHPNIAGIHGLDQQGDLWYLVLELVPGETLAARLARGALPLDDAVATCRQLAAGLEAAHEAGVVHRDVKPANVHITPDGGVKILDFGLAKPLRAQTSPDHGTTAAYDSFLMTEEGMVLGTPTYMSPEQARGKRVDRRTDIWAFGCVLFECLAGHRAFGGDSVAEILVAVVRAEPEWSALPARTPPRVRELLHACLVKDPRSRLRDAGDARLALERAWEPVVGADGAVAAVPGRSDRPAAWAVTGWVLALVGALWGLWASWPRAVAGGGDAGPAVVRTSVLVPAAQGLAGVQISPDGRRLVYGVQRRDPGPGAPHSGLLLSRELAAFEARPIAGTEAPGHWQLSPDGRRLAVLAQEGSGLDSAESALLKIIALEDGSARVVRRATLGHSLLWETPDTLLLLSARGSLSRLPLSGGPLEPLAELQQTGGLFRMNALLEGGRHVLVTRLSIESGAVSVEAVALATGERHPLLAGASVARDLSGRHLLALVDRRLVVVGLDLEKVTTIGAPFPVVDELVRSYALSDTGTLAYVPVRGAGTAPLQPLLARLDVDGAVETLHPNQAGDDLSFVRCAPDGTTISVAAGGHILLCGATGEAPVRLAFPGIQHVGDHAWHPDGERIAFVGQPAEPVPGQARTAVYLARADGVGAVEVLLASGEPYVDYFPAAWTADGSALLVARYTEEPATGEVERDILLLVPGDAPRPFVATASHEDLPVFSPDGRLVAYESAVQGRTEIMVCDWDPATGRPGRTWRASRAGGRQPRWARDGSVLYFLGAAGHLMAVTVRAPGAGGALVLGEPQPQFDLGLLRLVDSDQAYDTIPGGGFVLLQEPQTASDVDEIRVVQGWLGELRARLER